MSFRTCSMSSALACCTILSSPSAGSAPAWANTITFSRTTITYGIERMLNAPASSCSLSAFTLPKTTSACRSEAASNTGAKLLQGPHHGAQKSTITMSLAVTVCSKLSLLSSTVATVFSTKQEEEHHSTRETHHSSPLPRHPLSMQLAPWLGAARDEPGQGVEQDFGDAVQCIEMHAIEHHVHEPREQSFDEQRAAEERAHQRADGRILAERYERAEIAVAPRLERPAREPARQHAREVRGLLVGGLRRRRNRPLAPRPRAARAVADREYVGVARGLQGLPHHQLIQPVGFQAPDVREKVRRLDAGGPDRQLRG